MGKSHWGRVDGLMASGSRGESEGMVKRDGSRRKGPGKRTPQQEFHICTGGSPVPRFPATPKASRARF